MENLNPSYKLAGGNWLFGRIGGRFLCNLSGLS